jgi:hypothetical protein
MRGHSTINFLAKTLFACSARDGKLTTLQDVMHHLVNCRLLGLCVCAFAMCSCIVTSWDYPAVNIQEATRLRNTVPLKCTIDSDVPIIDFPGTKTALRAIMEEIKPSEGSTPVNKSPHCQVQLYKVGGYPSDRNQTLYDLVAAWTLLALPGFFGEEHGVVYTVSPPDRTPKKYEYRIKHAAIAWVGFLPIAWVNRWVDPRPAKAVEATYYQFLIDANRDGLLK